MHPQVQVTLNRALEAPWFHSIRSFGEENPDTVFYVIWREHGGSGFFSNVFQVLGHLAIADALNMTPVVEMESIKTFYNEADPINGTTNAWEYYFRQPCDVPLETVYKSKYVVVCNGRFNWSIYDDLETPGRLVRKYLHVQSHIQSFADKFVSDSFTGKKVLGIHFRGQEMARTPHHPTPATPTQMIERARMLLDRYSIDRIFIVSEEQAYVDTIKGLFGDIVTSTAAFRTYDINAYDIRPYPRQDHMYNLGLDVLRDAIILSRTDYLLAVGANGLAGGSNVSQFAQVLNAGAYQHVELIDNGVNPEEPAST
jgi:hypothetical protein